MKIEDTEVVCAPAVTMPNTWFIFRNNGLEVTITKMSELFKSDKKLSDLEIEFIENNLK